MALDKIKVYDMDILAERLQLLKVKRNFMQKDIAAALKIPLRTYQRYEHGEREPQASTIVAMARLFHVSSDYLLGLSDKE